MIQFILGALVLALILAALMIKLLREYERAVVFFLGRLQRVFGPGIIFIIPGVQQVVRVDLRTVVLDVPPQDIITRDNVSVKVNAVVYFRVVDPRNAIIQVVNFLEATSQLAQTTLRAVLGKHELDALLAEREKLNIDIQTVLDARPTPGASRCRTSRSSTSTSTSRWCGRSRARPRPSASAAPR